MSPMTREFSPRRIPGSDVAEYYSRRARGGVGLIITEGVAIDDPASVDHPRVPAMYGAEALAGWRAVTDAVHAGGGKIFPQLWHQGVLRNPSRAEFPEVPARRPSGFWGTPGLTSYPSEYVEAMRTPTAPMTDEDIADVVGSFARAARDAILFAGFDGIALHGAHGYLIDTFFWDVTNRRTDRYGETPKGRAAFGAEIIRAIRAEIGDTIPIMFRFSQHKQQDYEARFADTPEVLEVILGALADAGADIFDASSRRFNRPAFEGSPLTLAGWAKKLTGKPAMAVGGIGLNNWLQDTLKARNETVSIDNLDEAAGYIERGEFDFLGVGRALLNDPNWPEHVRNHEVFLNFDRSLLERLE